MRIRHRNAVALVALIFAGGACSPARPAPHAEPAPEAAPGTRPGQGKDYVAADVQFVQGMIGHHAQALVMTALLPPRTARPDMRLLAERIDVSQRDEIMRMRRWLEKRGERLPDEDAHVHAAMGHGTLIPGMLTQSEIDALAATTGDAFDRLFLQLMISHHEGALKMVEALLAAPGAGQEPELFLFASDVSADQTAEIRRMRRLLEQLRPD